MKSDVPDCWYTRVKSVKELLNHVDSPSAPVSLSKYRAGAWCADNMTHFMGPSYRM